MSKETFEPIGRNARGGWVNINNTCDKCGHLMPLPAMNKRHCPMCSTLCHVPNLQELTTMEEDTKKVCSKCRYKNLSWAIFCISCGTKL